MTRLARRTTSLLVAFYLLTAVATVYAECAWVLWSEERQAAPNPKGGLELTEHSWTLSDAFTSLSDCKAATKRRISDFVSTLRKTQPGITVSSDESGATVHGGKGRFITNDFKCLPDTVDPRGP